MPEGIAGVSGHLCLRDGVCFKEAAYCLTLPRGLHVVFLPMRGPMCTFNSKELLDRRLLWADWARAGLKWPQ